MTTTKTIILVVVVAIVAFFGGRAYGQHTAAAATPAAGTFGQGRGGFAGGMRGGAANGGFVSGTVLSKDMNGITIQNQSGGSKIVLVSPTTTVAKSVQGALTDVAVGSTVTVVGSTNSDGSLTAQSIQIRPTPPAGSGAPQAQPAQ